MGEGFPAFQTYYDEKLKVGYKWYDAEKKQVLFPFGHGLSYTTYSYSWLKVQPGDTLTTSFTVKNTGHDTAKRSHRYTRRCPTPRVSPHAGSSAGRSSHSLPEKAVRRQCTSIPSCSRSMTKRGQLEADTRRLYLFGGKLFAGSPAPENNTDSVMLRTHDLTGC